MNLINELSDYTNRIYKLLSSRIEAYKSKIYLEFMSKPANLLKKLFSFFIAINAIRASQDGALSLSSVFLCTFLHSFFLKIFGFVTITNGRRYDIQNKEVKNMMIMMMDDDGASDEVFLWEW